MNEWTERAACRDNPSGIDYWFPPDPGDPDYSPDVNEAHSATARRFQVAKKICSVCPVQLECFKDEMSAMRGVRDISQWHGIRAGMTPFQRWKLVYPDAARQRSDRERRAKQKTTN